MRILYGVQGTGNGHTTRARMMAEAFSRLPLEVDYIFSGKDEAYFNMEPFGDFRAFPGLSFVAEEGKIKYLKSAMRNNIPGFIRDVRNLNVRDYDLVITDFEPISAWAARINKVPSLGISHQNAFRYRVPVRGSNLIADTVIRWFAPADDQLGLHWHHFNQPILPPMIKTDLEITTADPRKIMVYLPFLPQSRYHELFAQFPEFNFVQYHPVETPTRDGNISCNPLSRQNFLDDFRDCSGIICSAGFGACSEAIHYGKKLLVVPLLGQMEQLSNAAALEHLGYGVVCKTLEETTLQKWLDKAKPEPLDFPDVAAAIAQWIVDGRPTSIDQLSQDIWGMVPGLVDLESPEDDSAYRLPRGAVQRD
jgi:uncharacterized protein (TIGR00661 family)